MTVFSCHFVLILGLTDPEKVNEEFLRAQLGHLPPKEEWEHLIFGRGSTDQLTGVVSQVLATKIMLETKNLGSLKGVIIKSIGTITEEDNDGATPMYLFKNYLPTVAPHLVPDVVVITEPTGCGEKGALGIYRGQRGRMIIEVEVIGQSSHGSMPWMGKNPLEFGARIIVEANDHYDKRINIMDDEFLGHGTRTASWCHIDTPSDCAVPDRFVFRFDRRLTVGETADFAVSSIENLESVALARKAGLTVNVRVPLYEEKSWCGTPADNPMIYPGWKTPEDHVSITSAIQAYKDVVSPNVTKEEIGNGEPWRLSKEPRLARFIFSTDGVGMVKVKSELGFTVPENKKWVEVGELTWPPMVACAGGHEQQAHKIGEFSDAREMKHGIAFLAAYPSRFVQSNQ
ncbi:hypothetical protein GEMRC1_013713 [Eukaryota sp. GEM-RC1]